MNDYERMKLFLYLLLRDTTAHAALARAMDEIAAVDKTLANMRRPLDAPGYSDPALEKLARRLRDRYYAHQ